MRARTFWCSSPLLLLAVVALAGCASGGRNWWSPGGSEDSPAVVLEAVVDGTPLPVFELKGTSWVEGRAGERYALRLNNRSARRVEVVLAVDGLDVIDGQPFDPERRGYILDAYRTVDIEGWRLNLNEVAAFRFSGPGEAYATQTGKATNLGVIEAALFLERERPLQPRGPLLPEEQARFEGQSGGGEKAAAPAADGARLQTAESRTPGLGTAFGERRGSGAVETEFERASSRPEARLVLRYDDRDGLCERGLKSFCWERGPLVPESNPRPEGGFADPPPDWRP